tara:strand:+ start:2169 stop:2519 length:351 start_codon:yes stop_codon:yes gene_type:complete
MYKPLPDCVTIKASLIEGLGLFATKKITKGTDIGISHIPNDKFENGFIRTPLGGFVNHSDKPNTIKITELTEITHEATNMYAFHLVAIRDIELDEEITLKYTLYNDNLLSYGGYDS